MSFLDNLKALVHVDISKLDSVHFSLLSNNKFSVTINNAEPKIVKIGSAREKEAVRSLLRDAVDEHGLLLESKAEHVLDGIRQSDDIPDNKELIEFFKGKISQTDLGILRSSLFIRSAHRRGIKVRGLVERLDASYGSRGRNISKLCSADYFESIIKTSYIKSSPFSKIVDWHAKLYEFVLLNAGSYLFPLSQTARTIVSSFLATATVATV